MKHFGSAVHFPDLATESEAHSLDKSVRVVPSEVWFGTSGQIKKGGFGAWVQLQSFWFL